MQLSDVKQHLKTSEDVTIEIYDSLPSTNDYFKGKPPQREFEFCFAENQTKGRGRLGRSWHSPAGLNLMFSCRWLLPPTLQQLGGLSSCVGLSLLSALHYLDIPHLMCKWPNDLYYQNKKLAGILIELHTNYNKIREVVIGIGLNVNMETLEIDIGKPWTSLKQILNCSQDRGLLAARIIESLIHYLKRFALHGWQDFIPEWNTHDYLKEKEVSIPSGSHMIQGIAKGIDTSGALFVQTKNDEIVACSSGEIQMIKNDI